MGYPNILKYYMWGYQVHFRIACETKAESIFNSLDRGLQPKVSLIGFLQNDDPKQRPICVDPENLEEIIPKLEAVIARADQLYKNHPDREMFYTGDGVTEKVLKRRRGEVQGLALSQIIDEINKENGTIAFTSRGLKIHDYEFFIVLELNRFVYKSHLLLTQQAQDVRFKLRLSLLESAIEVYLEEMASAFKETKADEFWDVDTRDSDELLREAANSFMYTISWAGRDGMGLHGLVETCNRVSQAKYESEEVRGTILVAAKDHSDIELLVEIKEPFSVRDHRKTRKLLEQAGNDISVITNAVNVLGLGRIKPTYNPVDESIFSINFIGLNCWDVMHQNTVLMQMRYGIPQFAQEIIDKNKFDADAKRIFGGISDLQLNNLYDLSIAITKLSHGAMLIISGNAEEEANRLHNRAITLKPFPLNVELLPALSAIDGGILIDENGICHANGVILDGIVGNRGDSARGSRYNSAVTYQEYFEFKKPTLIIVVSEDGMVDMIPTLKPQIAHSEINAVIGILEEIATNGQSESSTFDEAMEWLLNREFYLTEEECRKINEFNNIISSRPLTENMRRIYSPFKPDPNMNHTYYTEEPGSNPVDYR